MVSGRRALGAGLIAGILVLAFVLRIEAAHRMPYKPINDAGSYLTIASYVARTGDYSLKTTPGSGAGGTRGPSAYFPPGFPYFLAVVDLIDGHAVRRGPAIQPDRDSQAVLGTIAVALLGLVAFELFGADRRADRDRCSPRSTRCSSSCRSVIAAENLLTPLELAALYTALRARRAPRARPVRLGRRHRRAHRAGHADPRERRPDPGRADPGRLDGASAWAANLTRSARSRRRRCSSG